MAYDPPPTPRTQLYADPAGIFVHDLILDACRRFGERSALVDYSCDSRRRVTYSQYAELVECVGAALSSRFKPGEVVAISLFNSWEFCVAYHAVTLAGCIPTLLNPTFRDREVHHQLEDSGAAAFIAGGPQLAGIHLSGLPKIKAVFAVRDEASGAEDFNALLKPSSKAARHPENNTQETLAALPYSSGTTGMPKGVMLSHCNLVTNVYQFLVPGEEATYTKDDVALCCLPLYHIYGLNVVLNPILAVGGTLVLMPRFDEARFLSLLWQEKPTFLPLVPPLINCLSLAAEQGRFPRDHHVRYSKSGAAPLAPELASRFTDLTGIRVRQGYGMTEAAPVTHLGYIEPDRYRPDSIGHAVALTDCRLEMNPGASYGELVMRGPQFMLGYWNAPDATRAVLRDGWYWSGDVATVDSDGFYRIVDRAKEMIKYKGFAIAPAEVEAVLLEHPMVADCGVIAQKDEAAGEIPLAFVVLRDGRPGSDKIAAEMCGFVSERLTGYKQPREVRFVSSIPRNPSGKILRRVLREGLIARA